MVLQYTVNMAFEKKIGKKYLIGNLQNICLDLESIMLKFPQEAKVVNCNLFLFSCGCVLPLICSQATAGICGTWPDTICVWLPAGAALLRQAMFLLVSVRSTNNRCTTPAGKHT